MASARRRPLPAARARPRGSDSFVNDTFDTILGQPRVREFLRSSVASDRVSHAYLFCGPAGSNKTLAAYALAQAVLCKNREGAAACSDCDDCRRIMRKNHPDVHIYEPEGASGYLVEQVRDIVADVSLAPIRADHKVYILDRVDILGVQAANAFLKTLEEPPADVVLILLARTRESVLPTIVSRCQVVPFRTIPASEAAGIVVQNSGASDQQARIALQACDGSLTRAVEFLRSNERLEFRSRIVEIMGALSTSDDWDVIQYSCELVQKVELPLDAVRAEQEQELADNADFLAKSAIRQIEARNKRQLSAKTAESLRQLTGIVSSWLRDLMAVCSGASDMIVNVDVSSALCAAAERTDAARACAALAAARRCDEALSYNVSPQTCIDSMLLEIRDILYAPAALSAERARKIGR